MQLIEKVFDFITKKEVYGLIVIIIASLIFYNIGKLVISKILVSGKNSYEVKKRKTVVSIIESVYKYLVFLIAIIFTLELYGIDTANIIAGLGIAGVIAGLALQDTLKDIIGGISIIMDNYYVVGDYININNFTGQVIEFGLKSTKVKNFNGEVLIFANRSVDKIINISQKKANLIINIPTAYEEKTAKVERILNKLVEEIKNFEHVYDNSSYLGITELGSSAIIYTLAIECSQEQQWEVKRKVLKLVKDTYDKEKIKIPYEQVEVHNGQSI